MGQKVWLAGVVPELIISAVANMPLLFINPQTMPTRRQSSYSSETANSITQHCTGFHDSSSAFFFLSFLCEVEQYCFSKRTKTINVCAVSPSPPLNTLLAEYDIDRVLQQEEFK